MEPKVTVNARVVVVGASDTGLSFLEVLCFCPHLKFNNLTLVSTHGFPHDRNNHHDDDDADLAQLPLQSCLAVVTGTMVGINRKSKYVRVSNGRKVAYDHLILCTGLQYQVRPPAPLCRPITWSLLWDEEVKNQTAPRRHTEPVPSNLFTLNDLHDCRAARRWLTANFVELEENAIVYGNSIDVFTTVETLLGLGVRGSRIHLVHPPLDPSVACFSEPPVKKAVYAFLEEAEVRVHHNCVLAQMNNGDHPDPLTSVSFTTDAEPLHLQCGVSFQFGYDAFRSINSSFLVFDRRLVINAAFQTSDSAIFGAGPLTKFSSRYHTDEWSHANFNSKEVGRDLAAMLLPLFDPTLEPADEHQPGEDCLVPIYKQAKIQGVGRCPGGVHYLHFTKPSPLQDKGIATGRAATGDYFCLRLDCYELVETLTCYSLKPLPQLLGQLSTYYYKSLIPDLYSSTHY
uniref:Cilia- and flagella-associated protein 61-like n=1 Tax=Labrus bergylta TaxID=56723 RepID=A0A3Q3F5T9_9LABR